MIVIKYSEEDKEKWRSFIDEQISSGKSQNQWCEEQGIKVHIFRYWKRRLYTKPEQPRENSFVAIKPASPIKASKMRISIGKATIEINDEIDPILLGSVVKVLSDYV